jgi:type I restriction enzyme S subunit
MELKKVKLGDICEIYAGGDAPKNTTTYRTEDNNIPVFSNGIENDGLYGFTSIPKIVKPSVTISARGTIGIPFLRKDPYVPIVRLLSAIPKEDKIDLYYLYYATKLLKYKKDGSVQQQLTVPMLADVTIQIPPLSEQKKIASVLSALDDKIALNKKMNQKLERMAKRLYDYWFVQFDFPDKNGHPYKTTGGPMIYNPTLKREIPVGWEVKSLFDCSDILYGFPYATEPFDEENLDTSTKPYPVIRIRDIKDNSISAKTTETVDDKYRTKVNDLLIGMDGYFHMSFWPRNDDYVNQRITRIRQKELSVMVIYHQIAPFIKFKEDQAKGSTVGHLSDKDMKQINILVPNNPQLSEKFDSILNLITKNKQEISHLTKLRDKLLPLLMNGQVVVG